MKVYTAAQIRAGDAFTIEHEPVSGIDLMERAANGCVNWLLKNTHSKQVFYLFCGTGNNGGDGLAITRILQKKGRNAQAFLVQNSSKISPDCQTNKERLEQDIPDQLHTIQQAADWPEIPEEAIIIDALFGTGLNRPLVGLPKKIVEKINQLTNQVVAIDMPSGLQAEQNTPGAAIIKATHTLSFEFYKLAFLFSNHAVFTGKIHLISIGIHPQYIQQTETPYHLITKSYVEKHIIRRNAFSHKGTYGHALIIAGSYGKTGAAILATRAALHSGAGLVSSYVPKSCYPIMQIAAPEAMCLCDNKSDCLSCYSNEINHFKAIGIGPGIGKAIETHHFLKALFTHKSSPMVLDADALNLIGKDYMLLDLLHKKKALLHAIPHHSILTPHPKEFERLFGQVEDPYERLQLQIEKSKTLQVIIILKGHHTCITTPSGRVWFNTTGNAGMATGGSGDVLTGLLTGLLAQGYEPSVAAIIGVWLHGKAGDLALETASMESLTAGKIIDYFGQAFKSVHEADHPDKV